MITLSFAKRNNEAAERIENILQGASLAYQIEKNNKRKDLLLLDGRLEIEGEEAILKYLDELKAELHQWYYCAC